ncbi:MAG: hypothetical protein R3F05_20120 [Planctomycetota bacterium]
MKRERGRLDLRTGLGLLVVLGLVFGAGVLVGSGWQAKAPAAVELEPADVPAGPLATTPSERPELVSGAAPPPEASRELAAVMQALPPPPVARGDKRFEFEVRTETGEPLGGARLEATPVQRRDSTPPPTPRPGDADAELVADLERTLNQVRWRHAAKLVGTTDADGRCTLEGAIEGPYQVRTTASGWAFTADGFRSHSVLPGGPYKLVASARGTFSIEVLLPDGSPAAAANVWFKSGSASRVVSWTPANRVQELPPGAYRVEAKSGDGPSYRSNEVPFELGAGVSSATLRLELEEQTMLRVIVREPPEEAVDTLMVRLFRVPEGQEPSAELLRWGINAIGEHPHGKPGARVVERRGAEPGTWLLGVYHSHGGALLTSEVIEVVPGFNERIIDVAPAPRDQFALVHVTGPEGTDWSLLEWKTAYEPSDGGKPAASGRVHPAERSDGRYLVRHQFVEAGATVGTYAIQVRHPKLGSRRVTYPVGTAPDLVIAFDAPSKLDLHVRGVEGSRYAGRLRVQLSAIYPDAGFADSDLVGMADLGDDGRITFTATQGGPHVLFVTMLLRGFDTDKLIERKIDVPPGGGALDIDLPPLHVLEIAGARQGVKIFGHGPEHHVSRTVHPDDDGRIVVDGLPAGHYEARHDEAEVEFDVPATKTLRVK